MESVQVKRSIFPSAHIPRPAPPPPSPCRVYLPAAPFATPPPFLFLVLRVPAISISRHLLAPLGASRHPFPPAEPPSGWSLFNIDFLSKGRKYRESIELRTHEYQALSFVQCFAEVNRGGWGRANVRGMFASAGHTFV